MALVEPAVFACVCVCVCVCVCDFFKEAKCLSMYF